MKRLTKGERLDSHIMVRVSAATKKKIDALAKSHSLTKPEIIRQLVDNYWEELQDARND